jgi:hypothetical protein
MRGRPIDLTGQRFGRLTVEGLADTGGSGRIWECVCDCGNRRQIRTGKLRCGDYVSCGCLRAERMRERHATTRIPAKERHKQCSRCKETLPLTQFNKSKRAYSGYQTRCKGCSAVYECKRRFKVSMEEAEALVEQRKTAVCAVCSTDQNIHIDHDHATGKIRGFLCGSCNRALGMLQDDWHRIIKLVTYLHPRESDDPF